MIGRGGGSVEDLWAFNEEIVADSIYKAKTPIISAVGHEIDWVISDFVSDLRAPTPSSAMEMILPDTNELYQYIDSLSTQYTQILAQKIFSKEQELKHLKYSYTQHSIEKRLSLKFDEIQRLRESYKNSISFKFQNLKKELESVNNRFPFVINSILNTKQNQILNSKRMLESNNPKLKTKKGFAQLSKNKKVIDISELKVDDKFELQSDDIYISAKVIKKEQK